MNLILNITSHSPFMSPIAAGRLGLLLGTARRTTRSANVRPPLARHLVTLAIETSCDDTSVAVLEKHEALDLPEGTPRAALHYHAKVTSHDRRYSGIHPLVALDSHQVNLGRLVKQALPFVPWDTSQSGAAKGQDDGRGSVGGRKPDFISVTRGPGMMANLNVGLDTAKGLSIAWGIPLVAVNHMQAHALTPRLVSALDGGATETDPAFPFLSLLVSGGHTLLIHSKGLTDHDMMAETVDIAIGDMIDKAARTILPPKILEHADHTMYGRLLERFAFPENSEAHDYKPPHTRAEEIGRKSSKWGWSFVLPLSETASTKGMQFSFSGLESSVTRVFDRANHQVDEEERRALAREALRVAFEHLASRVVLALNKLCPADDAITGGISTLVVSGGVASNEYLRVILRRFLDVRGFSHVRLVLPPPELCVDNSAMIAWAGMEMFEAGWTSQLSCQSLRKWSLDPAAKDGGILGVAGWTPD